MAKSPRRPRTETDVTSADRDNGLEHLPPEGLDDLLSDIELPETPEEPDDEILAMEAEDLEKLAKEEPLDLLEHPSLMVELSDDPVRLCPVN